MLAKIKFARAGIVHGKAAPLIQLQYPKSLKQGRRASMLFREQLIRSRRRCAGSRAEQQVLFPTQFGKDEISRRTTHFLARRPFVQHKPALLLMCHAYFFIRLREFRSNQTSPLRARNSQSKSTSPVPPGATGKSNSSCVQSASPESSLTRGFENCEIRTPAPSPFLSLIGTTAAVRALT